MNTGMTSALSAYGFPELIFSGEGHVGSEDVDVLINYTKLKDIILFCINGIFLGPMKLLMIGVDNYIESNTCSEIEYAEATENRLR
jgi:hypothetical protein